MNIEEIIRENEKRKAQKSELALVDADRRVRVSRRGITESGGEWVPKEMTEDEAFRRVSTRSAWQRLRCRYDFQYWAKTCVRIKDKMSARIVAFELNAPQRRVAELFESQRRAGKPIRAIMLRARQWGGSTLVQMYMAWIQCTQASNWHSLICAQVGKTAASIRGMYDAMLAAYPDDLWEGDVAPKLTRYQGQELIREIAGRGCRITLGSSERQDSIRGADYAMAHLSEVAFWKDTAKSSPSDFIRAICGAIALTPLSLVVLESTANGVGNYFHTEWLRSERGESDKMAVFVPWHEIDIYSTPVIDAEMFWKEMDAYERDLWERGLTLEQINWYHLKRREYAAHAQMMAEYPTTPQEAFTNTGTNVFSAEAVERLRKGCSEDYERGEITSSSGAVVGPRTLHNVEFRADALGALKIWERRQSGAVYVAAVDVGGRSVTADWSVITVMSAMEQPRVVAQWRGHIDHDILTWKAAALAIYYNNALLVFESNTLESAPSADAELPDQGAYMLHELYEHYPNLYWRRSPTGGTPLPGFHTNRATKQMIITRLIGAVRDGAYQERDVAACDELLVYQRRANGSYGARQGYHDDILMTRAIALHAIAEAVPAHASLDADADLADFIRGRG